jgi:methyl-CpG-binding domain protein 4
MWKPPKSPYNLIQERLYHDPWKVLVACIFCNLTKRFQAEPIIDEFFERWPNPRVASIADVEELEDLLKPLGLSKKRAIALTRMSKEFLGKNWKEPIELYGIGKYGNDAWKIFCTESWKDVKPKDHALVWYHEWINENYA